MAHLGERFNVSEMDLGDDLLPAGEYSAQAIEGEKKDTQSGGTMLIFTFEILEGEFQGRRIWDRLNYVNSNPEAQRIARKALGKFAVAAGLAGFEDTDDFLWKPVRISVTVRKDKNGQYPDQNAIGKYSPYNTSAPQASTIDAPPLPAGNTNNAAVPPQQRAAAGGGSRPWDRR